MIIPVSHETGQLAQRVEWLEMENQRLHEINGDLADRLATANRHVAVPLFTRTEDDLYCGD